MSCLALGTHRQTKCLLSAVASSSNIPLRRFISSSSSVQQFVAKTSKKKKEARPRRQRGAGLFKSMPSTQLNHELFNDISEIQTRDFPDLTKSQLKTASIGAVAQFPSAPTSPVINYGLPRNVLVDLRLLGKPCSVIRQATVDLCTALDRAGRHSSMDSRLVLTGSSGCGKSYLLLQAVTACASKDWIVLYIPRAHNFVNSTTSYVYDPRTQIYLQATSAFQTLRRFLNANIDALQSLRLQENIEIDKRNPIPQGTTFKDVIDIGLKDATVAPAILSAVLEELGKQTTYPVLFAVDDFQSLYCKTLYRDPQFSTIRPYHLSMPRLIMEYASGMKTFIRGAFVGALSMQDTQFPLRTELREALKIPSGIPATPYLRRNAALVEYAQGLKALPVPEKLEFSEAVGVFEMWAATKALHKAPSDGLFLSKYSESCGNARDFVRGGILAGLSL